MAKKPLSDTMIARLKPDDWLDRPQKYYDTTRGLYLHVARTGRKTWRFRYQRNRKEHTQTLGRYVPDTKVHMSLAQARREATRLQAEIEAGDYPVREDGVKFEAAARDYMENALPGMRPSTVATTNRMFKYAKPLYRLDIDKIRPVEFRDVIKRYEGQAETPKKLRSFLNKVCRHAVGLGWCERNPIPDLPTKAQKKSDRKGRPAITDPIKFGALLRAMDAYDGHPTIKAALQILPHVFTRPGELRLAKWREFDFSANRWTIPTDRMKMDRDQVVPMSKQVQVMFWEQHLYSDDGPDSLVFPSVTHSERPISENTINLALRRLGYDTARVHTAHGFRKTASTLLNEAGKDREVIELCLAHGDPDKVRASYNFAEMMRDRTDLMQWWSDYLGTLKKNCTS